MANDIALTVKVDGVDKAISSLKDLKLATKQATNEMLAAKEGSKEYEIAAKKVSALKDKVEDLADSTKSLKGSGIERASAGFQQLGEGLKNLDFDKVKVGLTAMKTALAAVGIGLIVQAVSYLIENFDSLSKGSGLLAKALQGVGKIIESVKDGINYLTDAVGLTNSALDKMGETVVENATKSKEALAGVTHEYDNQIAAAKAAGKSTVELEKAKQQAIIDTNVALLKQTLMFMKAGGELDEAQKKLVNEQLQALKDAKVQMQIIESNDNKDRLEKHKKFLEDRQKQVDKDFEQWKANKQAVADEEAAERAAELELAAIYNAQKNEQEVLSQQDLNAIKAAESAAAYQRDVDAHEEAEKKKRAANSQTTAAVLQGAAIALQSTQQLSDFLFDMKMRKLKKGSEEELKAAKRQFQINKALAIQSSIISGIQGVINALSAQSVIPEPYGTILKVITAVGVGVAATINTAKIASTQFNESASGGGGGGSADTGGIGSAATAPPPTLTPAQTNQPSPDTKFGANGQNQSTTVKAVVVETEMTSSQNRVGKLEKQATF